MVKTIILSKTHTVHLKAGGEICNRLGKGMNVKVVQQKNNWAFVTWRNGKKKGWIHLSLGEDMDG